MTSEPSGGVATPYVPKGGEQRVELSPAIYVGDLGGGGNWQTKKLPEWDNGPHPVDWSPEMEAIYAEFLKSPKLSPAVTEYPIVGVDPAAPGDVMIWNGKKVTASYGHVAVVSGRGHGKIRRLLEWLGWAKSKGLTVVEQRRSEP